MTGEYENSTKQGRRGHAPITRGLCLLAALVLAGLGLVGLGGGVAAAHTPTLNATCEQLSVRLTSYQGAGTPNTVRVVVDGTVVAESAFGSSYARDFAFGDATLPHSWNVTVTAADDPDRSRGWSFSRSGTSAPCTPPDACPDLPGDQAPGTDCTQPGDEMEVRWLHGAPDCTTHTVTNIKQARSRSYGWDGSAWTPGPWSEWKTVTTEKIPTGPEQCPATEVTAAAPAYTPPNCASGPTLSYPPGDGYHWELSGTPETRTLNAVADAGRTLVGQTVFGPYDTTPWSAEERTAHGCVALLADPVVTQPARCGALGSVSPPAGEHLTYTISGGRWSDLPGGDYVVTATLADGVDEFGNAAAYGWQVVGRTASKTVTVAAAKTCVVPDVDVVSTSCVPNQDSSPVGGRIVLPTQEGVSYAVRDAAGAAVDPAAGILPPGTYVVTTTAAAGYEVTDANGFVGGVATLVIPAVSEGCAAVSIPVQPRVRAVDRCFTVDDRVVFDRENRYWTAKITDASHVTFTAKPGLQFLDDDGNLVDRLVLAFPPLTAEDCPLTPGDIEASCVGSVPYLRYALDLPRGFETNDARPLTITFVNPDGANRVYRDLPLSGRILWPGASAAQPQMWPGWDIVDGSYVDVGDRNFGWTRNGVTVEFDVNPHYETSVTYPPASVICANPPRSNTPPGRNRPPTGFEAPPLPNTGGPSALLLGMAGLLLLSGCAVLLQARKR
jgi:LPXTG-motif cell wall-anchored protein